MPEKKVKEIKVFPIAGGEYVQKNGTLSTKATPVVAPPVPEADPLEADNV